MKGSVRLKGKTWSYRIDLGKVDGKRQQVEKSGYKTEREALKAMNDVIHHYNHTGEYVENQKFTFQENYEQFMAEEAPATRAYATIKKYISLYKNHLKKEFGPSYLYQISPNRIQEFLNEKSLKYSEEYLKSIYKALNVLFAYGHKNKRMKKNPMDDVIPPPDPRHQREYRFITKKERQLIQQRIESTNVQTSYYIGLNTGVRVSECFGLCWSDIDFEHNRIRINKQLRFEDRKWCFTPLKTKSSYRDIEITETFADYLRALKEKQEESRRLYGEAYQSDNVVWDRREKNQDERIVVKDFINVKQNGAMLTSDSEKFLARIIKADCGVPFKFHNLRHTYATILAENGAHPVYVQAQLGHAKLEFTLRYYTHVTEKMGIQAMTALEHEVDVPFCREGFKKGSGINKREGTLVPDVENDRIDIRFSCEDFFGGLLCGTTMDVWLDDQWEPTRIEKGDAGWYLVGINTEFILGLKVRI